MSLSMWLENPSKIFYMCCTCISYVVSMDKSFIGAFQSQKISSKVTMMTKSSNSCSCCGTWQVILCCFYWFTFHGWLSKLTWNNSTYFIHIVSLCLDNEQTSFSGLPSLVKTTKCWSVDCYCKQLNLQLIQSVGLGRLGNKLQKSIIIQESPWPHSFVYVLVLYMWKII